MDSITLFKLAEMEAEGAMMKELAATAQDAQQANPGIDEEMLLQALLSNPELLDQVAPEMGGQPQEPQRDMSPEMLAALLGQSGGMPMDQAAGSPEEMSEEIPEEMPDEMPEESEEEPEETEEESEEDSGKDMEKEIKESAMRKAAAFLASF